jgi:Flp pilus assembly protein TadD
MALCQRARAAGDESADLAELMGLALVRLGDHDSAVTVLSQALSAHPARPHLHYLYAFAVRALGRLEEGRAALDQALRLAPEEPVYLRAHAENLSEAAQHEDAVRVAKEAVRCGPERAANHVTLGFVASAGGDKKLARDCYMTALSLDPEDAAAWNNLGCLDLDEGDSVTARERFREALRLHPGGERAQRNLAQTLSGRKVDDLTTFPSLVNALAEELAQLGEMRLLFALAVESEDARDVMWSAVRRPGRMRALLALGGMSLWSLSRLIRLGGPVATIVGAGTGLFASMAAQRWLAAERLRLREVLVEAQRSFEGIRQDWLSGRIERQARDASARLLVERVTLVLCRRGDPLRPQREGT